MIAETVFVMTILGCGNDTKSCDFVAEPQSTYTSQAACEAAVTSELIRYQDAAYPVVVGDCIERKGRVEVAQLQSPPPAIQIEEPNTFEKLRADADAIEFDPVGQTKELLTRTTEATKNTIGRLRDWVRGE